MERDKRVSVNRHGSINKHFGVLLYFVFFFLCNNVLLGYHRVYVCIFFFIQLKVKIDGGLSYHDNGNGSLFMYFSVYAIKYICRFRK